MSQVQSHFSTLQQSDAFVPPPYETPHVWRQFEEMMGAVEEVISPVWPLADYVAVNPFSGLTQRSMLDARAMLRLFSDCEMLMPLSYFAGQYRKGAFGPEHVSAAIDELKVYGGTAAVSVTDVISAMMSAEASGDDEDRTESGTNRSVRTIAEYATKHSKVDWSEAVVDEVSRYCAAHYDEGQAAWQSPWKNLTLYQSWRTAAVHDRNLEILGVSGLRDFIKRLPHTPEETIVGLMERLGVPPSLRQTFLLCQAFSVLGWSAWAKYQQQSSETEERRDLLDLIAIRLAYDVAVGQALSIRIRWDDLVGAQKEAFRSPSAAEVDHADLRMILLRAGEIAERDGLLSSIAVDESERPNNPSARKLAQMVFCIDVRSERMRRHLESLSDDIETFGFAGFFGMPIEYVELGQSHGHAHVPVLLNPQFKLHEGLHDIDACKESEAVAQRGKRRTWRSLWKSFQSSSVGCFSFVETTGVLYVFKLLQRVFEPALLGDGSKTDSRHDGLDGGELESLGPTLRGLNHQGMTTTQQVDLAESMLRNLGLVDDFARLVVLVGHSSQTENNPLAAGLDCGACGGHSGEPNARLAALLLNQNYVRAALTRRGIEIPDETYFLAGLHNTTTDRIDFFGMDLMPESHRGDVEELLICTSIAETRVREERLPSLGGAKPSDVVTRSHDWSEVRPEWGLAGNSAFIVGPRSMTRSADLAGRSFLHSYDHRKDPDGTVLETIMTAPMIVAHWINMQYYASVVDHRYFGSGTKTVHNVVGRFGVLSGNGGDLQTGLPWQSLHDGNDFQHQPLRLQVVIAAPRASIQNVIEKHELVSDLLTGGWLHLIALDEDAAYQFDTEGVWRSVDRSKDSIRSQSMSAQPV